MGVGVHTGMILMSTMHMLSVLDIAAGLPWTLLIQESCIQASASHFETSEY